MLVSEISLWGAALVANVSAGVVALTMLSHREKNN